MEKKSFIVHEQWVNMFVGFPDEDVGAIFKAMMRYTMSGDVGDVSPLHKGILTMMIDVYEADKEKYEETCRKRKEAVEKRWNKSIQSNTIEYDGIQKNTNVYKCIQNDTDKDKDKDMDMDMDMDMEKDMDKNMSFSTKSPYKRKDANASKRENRIPQCTLDEFIARWNSLPSPIPNVTVLKPGTKRYDSLAARLDEYGIDQLMTAVENIRHSSFLCGKSSTWHISLDWFVLPNNFPKVLDGNYTDSEPQEQKPKSKGSLIDDWVEKGLL